VDDCDHQSVNADAYAALAGLGLALLFPLVVALLYVGWCVAREVVGRWRG
jgi:hypothetical protein